MKFTFTLFTATLLLAGPARAAEDILINNVEVSSIEECAELVLEKVQALRLFVHQERSYWVVYEGRAAGRRIGTASFNPGSRRCFMSINPRNR